MKNCSCSEWCNRCKWASYNFCEAVLSH